MVVEVTQIEIGIPGSSSVFTQTLKLRESQMPMPCAKSLFRACKPCGARFVPRASCATKATSIHLKRHCVSKKGRIPLTLISYFFEIDIVDRLVKHRA